MEIFRFSQKLKNDITLHERTVSVREGFYFHENGSWSECSPLPGFSDESVDDLIKSKFDPRFPSVSLALSVLNRKLEPRMPESSYTYIGNYRDLDDFFSCKNQKINNRCMQPAIFQVMISQNCEDHIPEFPFEKIHSLNRNLKICKKNIFKIKVGRKSADEDLKVINRILTFNNDAKFILDPNMLWDMNDADALLSQVPAEKILYVEDPVRDLESSLKIASRFKIKLGLDELLRMSRYAEISNDLIGALIIKPMLTGSLEKCEKIIRSAAEKDRFVTISSSYESPLGLSLLSAWADEMKNEFGCRLLTGLDTEKIFL